LVPSNAFSHRRPHSQARKASSRKKRAQWPEWTAVRFYPHTFTTAQGEDIPRRPQLFSRRFYMRTGGIAPDPACCRGAENSEPRRGSEDSDVLPGSHFGILAQKDGWTSHFPVVTRGAFHQKALDVIGGLG
jgi:hypothetical protein